jgi:hypothetical protein
MADAYPKLVLVLIVVCLLVLLARGREGSPPAGPSAAVGRYEFMVYPLRLGRALLVRHDTATGEVWAMKNWDSDELVWIDLTDVRGSADAAEAMPEEPAVPAPAPAGSEGTAAPED